MAENKSFLSSKIINDDKSKKDIISKLEIKISDINIIQSFKSTIKKNINHLKKTCIYCIKNYVSIIRKVILI